MPINHAILKLDKFLSYVLGRRPDEFGLVVNHDGYVKIKDLLKAVTEEDGFRYFRKSSIDEILVCLPRPSIEIKDDMIRAVSRENLSPHGPAENPPRLLFTCVRKKAYPHVLKNGLSPSGPIRIILAGEPSLAEKMGRRIDQTPVTLTVHVQHAMDHGVRFENAGSLYLADFIPPGCFSGPPLPKEKMEPKPKEHGPAKPPEHLPGGYLIDIHENTFTQNPYKPKKKENEPSWKKDRKRLRKQKQRLWPD